MTTNGATVQLSPVPYVNQVYDTADDFAGGYSACSLDGCFQMNLSGVPGCRYAILASSDLTNWTMLQTNTSPFTFTDTNSAAVPRRFYRAQYVPGEGP